MKVQLHLFCANGPDEEFKAVVSDLAIEDGLPAQIIKNDGESDAEFEARIAPFESAERVFAHWRLNDRPTLIPGPEFDVHMKSERHHGTRFCRLIQAIPA